MAPTDECLHADHCLGGQVDLRLVEELELLSLKSEPQLVLYLDALRYLASHDVIVELIRIPAAVLRFLRRDHDVLEQSVRVFTVAREERDPYAGGNIEGVTFHVPRIRKSRMYLRRDSQGTVRSLYVLQHDDEFVGAPTRYGVGLADDGLQPCRHRLEHVVRAGAAE